MSDGIKCSRPLCRRNTEQPYRTCPTCRSNVRRGKRRFDSKRFLLDDTFVYPGEDPDSHFTKARVWNLRVLSGDYSVAELKVMQKNELA